MNSIIFPVEPLEPRIAPAFVVAANGLSATFTDVDGDLVTIKASKPILDPGDFTHVAAGIGEQLQAIDFSDDDAALVKGVNLTITAKPQDPNPDDADPTKLGNGHVNIGRIDATGRDVGAISIKGDLGQIIAGSSSTLVPAVKSLSVSSMGEYGMTTGSSSTTSDITGTLGRLTIKGDLYRVAINTLAGGKIGSANIGGSIFGGTIHVAGDLGSLKVGVDVFGTISTNGAAKSITIGGSMHEGAGLGADGPLGVVKIGGDFTNSQIGGAMIGSITIGGSMLDVKGGFTVISAPGKINSVTIRGDLIGGSDGVRITTNPGSGSDIGSVTIGGSLIGGTLSGSGRIQSDGAIGTVKIGRDILGGGGIDTGSIEGKRIASVTVGGSIFGSEIGTLRSGAITADFDIGTIKVKGSLVNAFIAAIGQQTPTGGTDVALKSLIVGDRVETTNIFLGYDKDLQGKSADAQAGAIKVGGEWVASNLIAGVNPSDGFLGDSNDAKLTGAGIRDNAVTSRIASIVIGGQVIGKPGTTDLFGFAAEEIHAFQSGGVAVPLAAGAHTDTFALTKARAVGSSLSTMNTDGFAVHVLEV